MDVSDEKPIKVLNVSVLNVSVALQMLAQRGGRIHRTHWYTPSYREGVTGHETDEIYVVAITRRHLGIGHAEESRRGPFYEMLLVRRPADAASYALAEVRQGWQPSTDDLLANDWVWMPSPSDNVDPPVASDSAQA